MFEGREQLEYFSLLPFSLLFDPFSPLLFLSEEVAQLFLKGWRCATVLEDIFHHWLTYFFYRYGIKLCGSLNFPPSFQTSAKSWTERNCYLGNLSPSKRANMLSGFPVRKHINKSEAVGTVLFCNLASSCIAWNSAVNGKNIWSYWFLETWLRDFSSIWVYWYQNLPGFYSTGLSSAHFRHASAAN